jgi:hypothetical protein
VQQREHPRRAVRGGEVEVRHTPPEQGVALAEVVMNVQSGQQAAEVLARLVHVEHLGHRVTQCVDAVVDAHEGALRHGVAQDAGAHGVALRVVGVQQGLRRGPATSICFWQSPSP